LADLLRPEHSGAFHAFPDEGLATDLDHSGANKVAGLSLSPYSDGALTDEDDLGRSAQTSPPGFLTRRQSGKFMHFLLDIWPSF